MYAFFVVSLFNDKEVETIVELLQKMLVPSAQGLNQSAIAIISPHKKQCKKISLACRDRDWNEIAIGRPETLQGKEKEVVIVSTGRNSSGFINNSRVSITRICYFDFDNAFKYFVFFYISS